MENKSSELGWYINDFNGLRMLALKITTFVGSDEEGGSSAITKQLTIEAFFAMLANSTISSVQVFIYSFLIVPSCEHLLGWYSIRSAR